MWPTFLRYLDHYLFIYFLLQLLYFYWACFQVMIPNKASGNYIIYLTQSFWSGNHWKDLQYPSGELSVSYVNFGQRYVMMSEVEQRSLLVKGSYRHTQASMGYLPVILPKNWMHLHQTITTSEVSLIFWLNQQYHLKITSIRFSKKCQNGKSTLSLHVMF